MEVKIYNTLTEKVEEIKPIEDNLIKMYSCGPTVYDFAHIGNLRYFVFVDLLKRTLLKAGYKVFQVMNITDIDDKIIQRANERKIDYKELAKTYEKYFFDDIKKLKILMPEKTPHATEEIPTMVEIISKLLKSGIAYKKAGSVYYNIGKYAEYGKLSKLDRRELRPGASVDIDSYEKDNSGDFVLWKGKKENEPFFETDFGVGRPGWHIECSAMSYRYLGEQFDIHTGGVDLIFPHHENEIAQSEMFCGHKTVNYWVHSEHLLVDGKKMSKSLGNFYTLKDLQEKGFSLNAVRLLFLSAHYKTQLNFTIKGLKASENTIKNINEFIQRLYSSGDGKKDISESIAHLKEEFFTHLFNNIDIVKSLARMHDIVNLANKTELDNLTRSSKSKILDAFKEFNEILLVFNLEKSEIIPQEIRSLAEERWNARQDRDFERADDIRNKLTALGYIIEDKKDDFIIRKK